MFRLQGLLQFAAPRNVLAPNPWEAVVRKGGLAQVLLIGFPRQIVIECLTVGLGMVVYVKPLRNDIILVGNYRQ